MVHLPGGKKADSQERPSTPVRASPELGDYFLQGIKNEYRKSVKTYDFLGKLEVYI